jgi:tetratricopeptide (TPR) repeat protein
MLLVLLLLLLLLRVASPLLITIHRQDKLKDRLGVMHSKAELLLQLGRAGEAEAVYRQLLDLNPDDYRVHEGLHRCLGIRPPAHGHTWQQQESQQPGSAGAGAAAAALPTTTAAVATTAGAGLWSAHSGKKRRLLQQYSPEERDKLGALYDSLAQSYRTSLAVQRMPLDFLVRRASWRTVVGVERGGGVAL